MTFDVYSKMCRILYESEDDEYLFAHAFLTMEWNLMARSDNCVSMNINNIHFQDDALILYFGKSKRNPYGDNSEKPWHVYSNPFTPHLCPVLALAKYTLSHPDLLQDGCLLFPGTSQYERFLYERLLKVFHKVIRENRTEFEEMGVKLGDLGAHSPRKGAITLVSSGCTVSPPMASICLRACWSMGPVKDRYIHYEKAGDEYVGRTVTGISTLDREFAVSPAYFELEGAEETICKNIDDQIKIFLNISDCTQVEGPRFLLMKFFFAAICFHYDHLNRNISEKTVKCSLVQFQLFISMMLLNFRGIKQYALQGSLDYLHML